MKLDSDSTRQPTLSAVDLKVAIVSARFNDRIVQMMREGAEAAWLHHGGDAANLRCFEVPGAYELPLAAKALAPNYAAVIALGCVIRGDTAHFDFVAGECAHGLMQVGLETKTPVIFGVLTVENEAQALERADPKQMNKGGEAMEAAIEMAMLLEQIRG
jgi:6,7-dimethyl-8-ribityllumazine synthase